MLKHVETAKYKSINKKERTQIFISGRMTLPTLGEGVQYGEIW